jgi:putative spermidine/putrescine transport system permease protein
MIAEEGQRVGPGTVAVLAWAALVLVFLLAPVVIILIVSFSAADYLTFPPPGLSLRWYQRFFGVATWRRAIGVSVQVASLTMLFATALGLAAAVALVRGRFRRKGLVYAVLLSPAIVPTVITAIGLYFFFVRLKATGSVLAMALGHTVLALPVVVIIIAATLQGFDLRLEQAALSLGASRLTALRRITLPLIAPGILSAALFAFLTSFDELLIPLFLSGVEVQTLTVRIWNSLMLEVDPTIAAVSSFLIGVTTAVLGASAFLRRRGEAGGVAAPPDGGPG